MLNRTSLQLNRLSSLTFKAGIFVAVNIFVICSAAFASDVQQVFADETKQLIKQSEKLIRRGDLAEAEKVLRRAIALSPTDSRAKLKLAFLNIKQRRLIEAYNSSFAIAQVEPDNAYAFSVLGTALLNGGKFPEARAVLYTALKLNKRDDLGWASLGLLEFYENDIESSYESLAQAVYLDPQEPDYHFIFAQVAARAERYKTAADAYYKFLAVSRNMDDDRRERIKGLINFLKFLGQKQSLYSEEGLDHTSVKFELTGNRPIIQLKVNGREEPLRFVLDTGSGISVISRETADRLNIDPITHGGFASGIGGNGKFEIVYGFLRQVQIGDVKIRNVPVYIRQFHTEGQSVDGYIGLSLISKFLTTIDYGTQTFSLARKDDMQDTDASGKSISLPLRLTSSGFLSGEVQLEGVENTLNFIVDTGASVSVISHDVANLETMTPFVLKEKLRVVGSAGVSDDVPSYMLPKVSFGSHSRNSITAIALDLDMINEASGFEQAGILGGNFLKNYRMTFDFKNSKVIFVPIEPVR
ncbi:MAG TPA: aspartyl protease family protein [Pyrinomonadaceae bacterium]|nr:aspartyl protease family protein [Pyrinomonadaceae bacterium]